MRLTRKEIITEVRNERKHHRRMFYTMLSVFFVVALLLVGNWQLQNIWIEAVYKPQQQESLSISQIRKNQKKAKSNVDSAAKPNKAISEHMSLSDITNSKKYKQHMKDFIIGAVYLPQAGNVSLPVILGNSNETIQKEGLAVGAVTPKSNMKIGKSSPFSIGGHNMNVNEGVLFSKLTNIPYGGKAYLTDTRYVYSYKVYKKYEVSPNQVEIFKHHTYKGKKILLMYTCNTDGSKREILEAYQTKKQKFSKAPKKITNKFNFSSKKKTSL